MAQTTLRDRIQSIEDAISAGHIDGAMADCQELLAHYPDALEIQRLLGEVYLAQGRLEEAQHTFDWILVNDPENVIAYCDRALICEHQSDIDTALDCYQQAYELSWGNSQIRQEFNNLSTKAGQQGQQEFMMSRAGLARLYMRGNLLMEALREWEAVLAATPDRLDARVGLMETYWLQGIDDQVEQIASRILEDIPNCEKALLLLAHVTSASNMQRARELVQRAELLDPELVMAQELFKNLKTSPTGDSFLQLLEKKVLLEIIDEQSPAKQISVAAHGSLRGWLRADNDLAPIEPPKPLSENSSNESVPIAQRDVSTKVVEPPLESTHSTASNSEPAILSNSDDQSFIGQQFGNYRLSRLLDSDTFASVYLAEHVHLNTQVAIKILHARLRNEDIKHFRKEIRIVAGLIHSHIIRILDFGVKENIPFLVMDYAASDTLFQHHSRGIPPPLTTIVGYVKQIAAALQYAHDKNWVHGSITPRSMYLSHNDEILLGDFDKHSTQALNESSELINEYTAPEQLSGELIPASDQYALGAIIYEWLSGLPPKSFDAADDRANELTRTSKIPGIPFSVEKVILTALAEDPKQRYMSIEEFSNAFEQAIFPDQAPKTYGRIGQQFGSYRLTRFLGNGGFADVYLGKHIHLNTVAAVKVLRTKLVGEEVAHFQTEARTIASLNHHNIVRILDFDVEGDIPFLVMDYAPYGTLRDRHPKGSVLPADSILSYVKQIAAALQYAHDKRVVHRDIKPENMLIGANNELLLSDFGIAVAAHSALSLTPQSIQGTAVYMAPEQVQGSAVTRSDQYSLGIVIYEWLCGTVPFKGSFFEIANQHIQTPLPRLREKNRAIRPAVEEVIMIALAKNPQDRFMSIQAFAKALELAIQGK
jgi:serine/threonine protein kinase